MKSIDIRKDLTDEWKVRGLQDEREYAMLTNVIYREWAGMTAGEYKRTRNGKKMGQKVISPLNAADAGALDVDEGPASLPENKV